MYASTGGIFETADRRDRARRRLGRGSHAGEAACLLLGEDDAANVCRLALEARGVDVDDRELRVRILRRDACDRVAHQETDGDDEVVALLGGRREVRDVVGGALRDQRAALDPVLRLRLLETLVGERVEPLVVEAADVRDQRDLDRGRLGLGRRRGGDDEEEPQPAATTARATARMAMNVVRAREIIGLLSRDCGLQSCPFRSRNTSRIRAGGHAWVSPGRTLQKLRSSRSFTVARRSSASAG